MELYRKVRPDSLNDILGQPDAVRVLRKMKKGKSIPHAIMIGGPSGCGKTTIARIIRKWLKCGDEDFHEINIADFSGIATIREIRNKMEYLAMYGDTKVWLLDECHNLSREGQEALLKILEDPQDHCYFILCTTEPNKLIRTVLNRCSPINVKSLRTDDLKELVTFVAKSEKGKLTEEVLDSIVGMAEGSARKALVLLEQVLGIDDEEDQLSAIQSTDLETRTLAFDLAKLLINPRSKWATIATAIKKYEDTNWEGFRYLVLEYARKVLLGGSKGAARASLVITVFGDNWYDSKGAGLANSCYQVVNTQ